jgi:hypothetical protein
MKNGRPNSVTKNFFTQSKTSAEMMDIPIAEPLAAVVAATPMIGVKTRAVMARKPT